MIDTSATGSRARAVGLLVLTLAVGGMAGMTLERVRTTRPEQPRPRPERGERGMPRFFERLELSEAQRSEIRVIFDSSREQTAQIMNEMLPRIQGHLDSVQAEIRAILTDEQQIEFDSITAEWRSRGFDFRRGGRRGSPRNGHRDGERRR